MSFGYFCREEGPAEYLHVSLDQGQCFYSIRLKPKTATDTELHINNILVEPDGAATIVHVTGSEHIKSLVRYFFLSCIHLLFLRDFSAFWAANHGTGREFLFWYTLTSCCNCAGASITSSDSTFDVRGSEKWPLGFIRVVPFSDYVTLCLLQGVSNDVIFTIDLKEVLGGADIQGTTLPPRGKCDGNDFENWTASAENGSAECILGKEYTYRRVTQTNRAAACFLPKDYEMSTVTSTVRLFFRCSYPAHYILGGFLVRFVNFVYFFWSSGRRQWFFDLIRRNLWISGLFKMHWGVSVAHIQLKKNRR